MEGPEQENSDCDLGSGGVGGMARKGKWLEKHVQCLEHTCLDIEEFSMVEFLIVMENSNTEM